MKSVVIIAASASLLSGCFGHTATNSELTGQAKKLVHRTPLICPDYYALDVSLGVIQNGVGSMSSQDMWLVVDDSQDIQKMQDAVSKGTLVHMKYDTMRLAICTEEDVATSFLMQPLPTTSSNKYPAP